MADTGKNNKSTKPLYLGKDLKIFADISSLNESQSPYTIQQNPIDRIKETVELILRVFPREEKIQHVNKIYFDKV